MNIRKYTADDLELMIAIWNEVVEDGIAFTAQSFAHTYDCAYSQRYNSYTYNYSRTRTFPFH